MNFYDLTTYSKEKTMKKSLIHTIEKPEKKIMIYGLLDPTTEQIRYIGLTCNGFGRIRNHYNKITNTALSKWVQSLKQNNNIFKPIYLQYFENDSLDVDEAEVFWINYFKMIGADLLNHEKGGRSLSVEPYILKENRSRSLKGIKKSPVGCKNIKQGQTKAFGLKIKDQFGNIFNSLQEAADHYGIHKALIQKAVYRAITSAKGIKFERIGGGRKPIDQIKSGKWIKKGRKPIENPIEDQFGNKYINIVEASKQTGVSLRVVHRILKGEIKNPKKGILFKYSRIQE